MFETSHILTLGYLSEILEKAVFFSPASYRWSITF